MKKLIIFGIVFMLLSTFTIASYIRTNNVYFFGMLNTTNTTTQPEVLKNDTYYADIRTIDNSTIYLNTSRTNNTYYLDLRGENWIW